ncbi:MAG: hypothetical protein AAGJ18_04230 [Bacteroidota bacterium]
MSNIVIQPTDQKKLQFLLSLLDKLGVNSRIIGDETLEDIGLSLAMKNVDRTDKVSESDVMDLLNATL